ncbi:ECF transporter S component [Lentilactobacillus farraginis]|uniref:Riboflavin transporter n=1 Tax=Lentilactobacillus farraginis DSM 18382 = JCM 14108 TaxID=1423743 RepID=X0PF27_9LACO|nr:ECF transporter S component [Lentilactobacillus farraginis]KRM07520.1 integral membrane protein [Lentilactobacillus farraginis DSM 18382 = JCM 14108]GAF35392.1 substrate-specific component RibU of riboflavin ECF transporter [Lentilactobacillus farraginis DSM 18382 = JCM 14108]
MEHSGRNQLLTARLVEMSVLAGCSYVLMFFSLPIIPIAPYMKIDLSDMPILIGTVLFGATSGITIAGLKSILYWVTTSGASIPGLIGVGSSFLASVTLILAFYWGNQWFSSAKTAVRTVLIIALMTISLTIIMSFSNWVAVIPLYMNILGMKINMPLSSLILYAVVPFNLIKGIVVGGLFFLIKGSVLPRLRLK